MSTLSGNSNDNAHIFKMTPPVLTKEYGYSNWKYDLTLTSLEKEKQGLAVFLSLTSQKKQVVRTVSIENFKFS